MTGLSAAGRRRLRRIRDAESLAALADVLDVDDEHEAYFEGKKAWRLLRGRELGDPPPTGGIPGSTVRIGDVTFHVHGITHADTRAEREFLREHVAEFLEDDHEVYSEQGIRGMYFEDLDVCAMDDYRWALRECERLGFDSHLEGDPFESLGESVTEGVNEIASQFQSVAFSLVDASGDRFGREFEQTLGSIASSFFSSHADLATGSDFASFRLRAMAAANPDVLWKLQRYYECEFLPQPLEREWLRRHDPELELVTHARNARMAAYALEHADTASDVHLIVGAAHQPGVRYYLERYRDEDRALEDFDPVIE